MAVAPLPGATRRRSSGAPPERLGERVMNAIRWAVLAMCLVLSLAGDSPAADVDRYGDVLPPGAVARLGTTRLGHSKVIHAVAFSPDGKTLASRAVEQSIRLWDVATGRMIPPTDGPSWLTDSPAFYAVG